MTWRTFDEKLEAVYSAVCEDPRWYSVYRLAKRLGYTHSKPLTPVIDWLEREGYIVVRMTQRPNGAVKREIRAAVHPCPTDHPPLHADEQMT